LHSAGQKDLQKLASLYRILVKKCKFDEFWKAMVDSTMVEPFGKYGLDSITELCNSEPFMKSSELWCHSVWELKRFTRLLNPEPHRAVAVDYGFQNCPGPQERVDLRNLYVKFFSTGEDEMNLHQACMEGRLAPFLESVLGTVPFPNRDSLKSLSVRRV
jgi:hypothetical protein